MGARARVCACVCMCVCVCVCVYAGPVACQLPSASMDGVEGARPHAIRLLMAFMGAVLGSGYALEKFVESAFLVGFRSECICTDS